MRINVPSTSTMMDTSHAWFVYAGKIKVRYFLNTPRNLHLGRKFRYWLNKVQGLNLRRIQKYRKTFHLETWLELNIINWKYQNEI
jgi:hypothetical protein